MSKLLPPVKLIIHNVNFPPRSSLFSFYYFLIKMPIPHHESRHSTTLSLHWIRKANLLRPSFLEKVSNLHLKHTILLGPSQHIISLHPDIQSLSEDGWSNIAFRHSSATFDNSATIWFVTFQPTTKVTCHHHKSCSELSWIICKLWHFFAFNFSMSRYLIRWYKSQKKVYHK